MPKSRNRPLGVTVMAIIVALNAIITILLGLTGLGLGFGLGLVFPVFGAFTFIAAIFVTVWGVFGFYVAKGLWALDKWAWTWSLIWLIVDAVLALLVNNLFTVVMVAIVMIYLYTKKSLFR